MTVKVKIDNKQFNRKIKQLEKKLKKPKPALNKIAQGEIDDAQKRIRTTKTSPKGVRWAAWSYETLKQRTQNGTVNRGLLYVTGLLLKSFFKRVSNDKAEVRNNAPYADYLQKGTRKMPARPYLGRSNDSIKRIKQVFRDYLRF